MIRPLRATRARAVRVSKARTAVVVSGKSTVVRKRGRLDEGRWIVRLPSAGQARPYPRIAAQHLDALSPLRSHDFNCVIHRPVPPIRGDQVDLIERLVPVACEDTTVVDAVLLDERGSVAVIAVDETDVNARLARKLAPVSGGPFVHVGLMVVTIHDSARIHGCRSRRDEYRLDDTVPVIVVQIPIPNRLSTGPLAAGAAGGQVIDVGRIVQSHERASDRPACSFAARCRTGHRGARCGPYGGPGSRSVGESAATRPERRERCPRCVLPPARRLSRRRPAGGTESYQPPRSSRCGARALPARSRRSRTRSCPSDAYSAAGTRLSETHATPTIPF